MAVIFLTRGQWTFDENQLLGRPGGFGSVHPGVATDGKPVAVKLLDKNLGDLADREIEFAQGHAGKESRHLISIYDAGVDPSLGQACIVMERANYSLRDFLVANAQLTDDAALNILAQIVAGLIEAGDWIHRDLKPENILFANGTWRIADFGIGRVAEATTASNTLKGALSPPYAAPEQWKRARATHATDVYALGCIATELLTGSLPFRGPDYERQHQADPPTIGEVSNRLKSLLLRMLAKPDIARPSIYKLASEIETVRKKSSNASPGTERLVAAAAVIAHEKSIRDAQEAAEAAELAERQALSAHARQLLLGIADQLFDSISEQAPVARVSKEGHGSKGVLIYRAALGQAQLRMSIGEETLIGKNVFRSSLWDAVCMDAVIVESERHKRSASLWFARTEKNSADYNWIEMSYFQVFGGSSDNHRPCYLTVGRDAVTVASNVIGSWSFAQPVRLIQGEGVDAFCERWIDFFARAADGSLQSPTYLPES